MAVRRRSGSSGRGTPTPSSGCWRGCRSCPDPPPNGPGRLPRPPLSPGSGGRNDDYSLIKELKMSEEDAEAIVNSENWEAYKKAKEQSTLARTSNCFLTTATCVALGCGDECPELNRLRWFRDNILRNMVGGPEAIAFYYRVAPTIVRTIESLPDSRALFSNIYDT